MSFPKVGLFVTVAFDSPRVLALDKRLQVSFERRIEIDMKAVILFCSIVLLFSACKRGATTTTDAPAGSNGTGVKPSAPGEARALLEKGKQLYREDQDSAAAEAFQQALALDPSLAEAHFRLGLTYDTLNKAEEAEAEYKKAVEGYKKYLGDHPRRFRSSLFAGPDLCESTSIQRRHQRIPSGNKA